MPRHDLDQWLWQVGHELQRLSEEMTPAAKSVAKRTAWEPRIDFIEGDNFVAIKAELAGIRAEDMRLTYYAEKNVLTIRGKRADENHMTEAKSVHILEIPYGEFEREILIPGSDIDPDTIQATYDNGFLLIVAKRTLEPRPTEPKVTRRSVIIHRI